MKLKVRCCRFGGSRARRQAGYEVFCMMQQGLFNTNCVRNTNARTISPSD